MRITMIGIKAAEAKLSGIAPPRIAVKARGVHPRHRTGEMNNLEKKYAETLDLRKVAGEIVAWWFEEFKWRIADKCWFCPDFMVMLADGTLECVDVKARWSNGQIGTDDSRVKLKAFAERAPFRVSIASWDRKTGWSVEEF